MRRVWNRFSKGGVLGRGLRRQSLRFEGNFGYHLRLLLYCFGGLVPGGLGYGKFRGAPQRFGVRAWLLDHVRRCDNRRRLEMI